MENNSDREMRDKLLNVEYPFDPQAWEQMNTMLDEKRDRKGFFWWWFGGIAAALLISAGTYGYLQFERADNNNNSVIATSRTTINNNNTTNNNIEPLAKGGTVTTATRHEGAMSDNITANTTPGNQSHTETENQYLKPAQTGPGNKSVSRNTFQPAEVTTTTRKSNGINSPAILAGSLKSRAGLPKSKTGTRHQKRNSIMEQAPYANANNASAPGKTAINNTVTTATLLNSNVQPLVENPAVKPLYNDPITLNPKMANELTLPETNNDNDAMQKKDFDDVNLKKLNKKIFVYSLGICANITGATLGHQAGTGITNAFSQMPSYMAGLTQDFMFFKRFAITNGILFSQTSFSVFGAKTTYPENLASYTSNITELAIPLGIKAYAISKPKFRFYLGAGIINHIKLKETFAYKFSNINNTSSTNYLPAQTQFSGNSYDPATLAYAMGGTPYSSTSDFSINHAKRYYTSFYAQAGAEFIIRRHVVLFTEPLFYMALQKVGVQNKYKYNLGLSGGFRYQF